MPPSLFCLILCLVGMIESFVRAINILFLQKKNRLGCFLTDSVNIFIWYYVLITIIDSVLQNKPSLLLIFSYAFGYGVGDVIAIDFHSYLEALAKKYGAKLRKFRRKHLQRRVRRKR
jgi:uncharacterized protein YebE (UPF0316 family)